MSPGGVALLVFVLLILGGCLVALGWVWRGWKASNAVGIAATEKRTEERKVEAKREAAAPDSEGVLEEMQK